MPYDYNPTTYQRGYLTHPEEHLLHVAVCGCPDSEEGRRLANKALDALDIDWSCAGKARQFRESFGADRYTLHVQVTAVALREGKRVRDVYLDDALEAMGECAEPHATIGA